MFSSHPFPEVGNVDPQLSVPAQPASLAPLAHAPPSLLQEFDLLTQIAHQALSIYDDRSIMDILTLNDQQLYQFLSENCGKLFTIRNLLQLSRETRQHTQSIPAIRAMLMPIVIQLNQLRHIVSWWDEEAWRNDRIKPQQIADETTIDDFFTLVTLCDRLREQFERREQHAPRLMRLNAQNNLNLGQNSPSLWR